jgi:hypothetical protein
MMPTRYYAREQEYRRHLVAVASALNVALFIGMLALASLFGIAITLGNVAILAAFWIAPDIYRAWSTR